jgi:hypothetical protein
VSLFEAEAIRDQRSLENSGLHDIYFCVFARRSHFLVLKLKVVFLPFSVLALAKAGPDCDPDGGPLTPRSHVPVFDRPAGFSYRLTK